MTRPILKVYRTLSPLSSILLCKTEFRGWLGAGCSVPNGTFSKDGETRSATGDSGTSRFESSIFSDFWKFNFAAMASISSTAISSSLEGLFELLNRLSTYSKSKIKFYFQRSKTVFEQTKVHCEI